MARETVCRIENVMVVCLAFNSIYRTPLVCSDSVQFHYQVVINASNKK